MLQTIPSQCPERRTKCFFVFYHQTVGLWAESDIINESVLLGVFTPVAFMWSTHETLLLSDKHLGRQNFFWVINQIFPFTHSSHQAPQRVSFKGRIPSFQIYNLEKRCLTLIHHRHEKYILPYDPVPCADPLNLWTNEHKDLCYVKVNIDLSSAPVNIYCFAQ